MAGYGQTSTSQGTYSLDMSAAQDNLPPPYGQTNVPSQSYMQSQDEFQFVQGTAEKTSLEGSIPNVQPEANQRSAYGIKNRGKTGQFLESKGFGWLMEEEDIDEEDLTPLLEELDIDLKDIYYKLRCVLFPLPQLGFNRHVVRESPDFWGPLVVILLYSLVSLYGQFRIIIRALHLTMTAVENHSSSLILFV